MNRFCNNSHFSVYRDANSGWLLIANRRNPHKQQVKTSEVVKAVAESEPMVQWF